MILKAALSNSPVYFPQEWLSLRSASCRTRAQDGDPVDILVLSDEDLPVGTLVTMRLAV
ncbi:MAG TPA: hypothetical protein VF637_15105 [Sphingomicrobium sp.]|jgi:inorganic pyrophosphatase